MNRFVVRRLLAALLTLFVVSVLVFLFSRLLGNPVDVYLDMSATKEDRALLAAHLGLDKPLYVQYCIYMARILLRADFGKSFYYNRPVVELFGAAASNTLQLSAVSFLISMGIAIPVGVLSAVRRGSVGDWVARGFVLLGQSLPHFWLGIMLILLLSVKLDLFPPATKGGPSTFVLPAITLGWHSAAGVMRMVRSSMLEVLSSDFIRTARGKGLNETAIVWRHALKNAMIPTVAYCSVVTVRSFVMGSIVVETVFGWPGLGRLAYEATFARDFPTIQGIVIMIASVVLLVNLLGDILYGWLDPRIRYS